MSSHYFEAVEICPHCDSENVYPMWDVNVRGFVAICSHCGEEILLCDECIHHEDELNKNSCGCDWCKTECGGKCFRGVTREKLKALVCYYTDSKGNKKEKVFNNIEEALDFTKLLDKKIENGTCGGYFMEV